MFYWKSTYGLFVRQTGSAKRLGSDADRPVVGTTGASVVSSNGPKQTAGPPVRDGTQVCFVL